MNRRSALIGLALFIIIGFSVAVVNKTYKRHMETISLRLQWIHQAQFVGFYVAKEKGFYAARNIDLTIKPGGIGFNVPTLIARGSDDVGIWVADQVLRAFDKEKMPIRAIGTVYNRSLAGFMVKDASSILTPKDFAGKRVGVLHGFDTETIFVELLRRFNVDRASVREYPVTYNLLPFLHGDVDIWPAYVINEPLTARENHVPVRTLDPATFGVRFYSDTLVVNEAMLQNRKPLIMDFLEASEEGWRYALSHTDEGIRIVMKFDPGLNREHEEQMLSSLAPYMKITDPLFGMDPQVWSQMADVLASQGDITDRESYLHLCDFQIADQAHQQRHPGGQK